MSGEKIKAYKESTEVLRTLKEEGYLVGIASRSSDPDGANQLIHLLNWDKYIDFREIYPGCKITHFKK